MERYSERHKEFLRNEEYFTKQILPELLQNNRHYILSATKIKAHQKRDTLLLAFYCKDIIDGLLNDRNKIISYYKELKNPQECVDLESAYIIKMLFWFKELAFNDRIISQRIFKMRYFLYAEQDGRIKDNIKTNLREYVSLLVGKPKEISVSITATKEEFKKTAQSLPKKEREKLNKDISDIREMTREQGKSGRGSKFQFPEKYGFSEYKPNYDALNIFDSSQERAIVALTLFQFTPEEISNFRKKPLTARRIRQILNIPRIESIVRNAGRLLVRKDSPEEGNSTEEEVYKIFEEAKEKNRTDRGKMGSVELRKKIMKQEQNIWYNKHYAAELRKLKINVISD